MELIEGLCRYVCRVIQHHQALADIAQLTHIAGPRIAAQDILRLSGKLRHPFAHSRGDDAELPLHQRDHIVRAFPERGNIDLKGIEPVQKVTAKAALGDLLLNIHICSRNDTHIDGNDRRAADAADLLFLQDPQQLCLQRHRDLSDLVQEDRALVRQLKQSHFSLPGSAGEGTRFIAEQFAFQQGFR